MAEETESCVDEKSKHVSVQDYEVAPKSDKPEDEASPVEVNDMKDLSESMEISENVQDIEVSSGFAVT